MGTYTHIDIFIYYKRQLRMYEFSSSYETSSVYLLVLYVYILYIYHKGKFSKRCKI